VHAVAALERYKKVFGKDLVAAYVFGAVGRGFPSRDAPKDIDLILLLSRSERGTPLESHGNVNAVVLNEGYLNESLLAGDSPEARFHRSVLSLPTVCLHGQERVNGLRRTALRHLHEEDFEPYVALNVRKRREKLRSSGRRIPPDSVLREWVVKNFGVREALARRLLGE
jgi:hypothetical protein